MNTGVHSFLLPYYMPQLGSVKQTVTQYLFYFDFAHIRSLLQNDTSSVILIKLHANGLRRLLQPRS